MVKVYSPPYRISNNQHWVGEFLVEWPRESLHSSDWEPVTEDASLNIILSFQLYRQFLIQTHKFSKHGNTNCSVKMKGIQLGIIEREISTYTAKTPYVSH